MGHVALATFNQCDANQQGKRLNPESLSESET